VHGVQSERPASKATVALQEPGQRRGEKREPRPKADEQPTRNERTDNSEQCRNRLANAELLSAVLLIAQRSKVSVVTRPIDRVGQSGHDHQPHKGPTDTMHRRKKRKRYPHQNGADHNESAQPDTNSQQQEETAQDQAQAESSGRHQQHAGHAEPGLEQIDGPKRATAAERDAGDPVMKIEKVDGTIVKEGHDCPAENGGSEST